MVAGWDAYGCRLGCIRLQAEIHTVAGCNTYGARLIGEHVEHLAHVVVALEGVAVDLVRAYESAWYVACACAWYVHIMCLACA